MRVYLSASQITTADNCRREHWYKSVAKIKTTTKAANLAFGTCVDMSSREYLEALTLGRPLPDAVARFEELWAQAQESDALSYSATQTPAEFETTGCDLMRQFPGAWEQSGYQIALDCDGNPLMNLRLQADLGNEVFLTGVIDFAAYSPTGDFGVLDEKTAATEPTVQFARRSDQLTAYNILMDAHSRRLGLPALQWLGFFSLIKRKRSSHIEPVVQVVRRTDIEVAEFIQKAHWLADDIRRKRFPKASRHPHNSPCAMCDYAQHCIDGIEDGLIIPQGVDFAA